MSILKRSFSASTIYLIYSGASSLFFALIFTVNLVYQLEVAKLSPLQLVLVGTALETVAFLCQVPTGVFADVYSRRLAVILGTLIIGVGYIIEGSIPRFETVLLGQTLFGIGAALADGAQQAWIANEVGEEHVGHIFLRSSQIGLVGGLIGAPLSVALASLRLNVPVVLGGALLIVLAVFLMFFMPENGFAPTPKVERQSWRHMRTTFSSGMRVVRGRPVLLTILLIGLFYGLYSEGFDRLSTAHLVTNFIFPTVWSLKPVVWFGIFSVVGTLLSLGATELVRRSVNINNQRRVMGLLFGINAFGVLCLLVFALAGNFYVAVIAFLSFGVFRSVNNPLYTTWLTQNVEPKVRATVISISGQVDAFGQIVGGPPVGYVATIFSLRAALIVVSVILSPVLLLFAYAFRKAKPETVPVEEVVAPVSEPI